MACHRILNIVPCSLQAFMLNCFSHVPLFAVLELGPTRLLCPWDRSGLPCPLPGDPPNPGLNSYIYIWHLSIHFSVNGLLGCFHALSVVNDSAINIRVHVSFIHKIILLHATQWVIRHEWARDTGAVPEPFIIYIMWRSRSGHAHL